MNKQIEEMAKAKKCNTCIHNAVCEKLEEFRDPLGWVDTEGEFGCSYYEKSTDVAREVIDEINNSLVPREFHYSEIATGYFWALCDIRKLLLELKKKYKSEGAE